MGFSFNDLEPGDFQPTTIDGGLPKLIRIWERLRDLNVGGYSGGVLVSLKPLGPAGKSGITSCSPFTATAIYMALDPRPVDTSQAYSLAEPYEPLFDGGKPLGPDFYRLHNSFGLETYGNMSGKKFASWKAAFKSAYVDHLPQLQKDFSAINYINHSAGSVIAHNLGVRVDPKQMRRGDMVGIDWHNGHGHATFCWNVHLDKNGEVDCFQFISSNGSGKVGVGVSLFRYPDVDPEFIEHSDGKYKKKKEMFAGVIADPKAYPQYITKPYWWFGLPGVKKGDIDLDSFGVDKKLVQISYANTIDVSLAVACVARLHGFAPPDPYLRADGKEAAATPDPPKPVAKATSKPVTTTPDAPSGAAPEGGAGTGSAAGGGSGAGTGGGGSAASGAGTGSAGAGAGGGGGPASAPDASPKPPAAEQGHPQPWQVLVEANLAVLWVARWIGKDPGDPTQVNSAESQAAIRDYQEKYMGGDVPSLGHADPATRKRLTNAAAYAIMMPMVNASLHALAQRGVITKQPGDNPLQLDEATKASVKEFQGKNGLTDDGIPGHDTQAKLAAAIKKPGADAAPAASPPAAGSGSAPASDPAPASPAAILTMYWIKNHGPAGAPVSVKVTANAACEGQGYKIGLYQGDTALGDSAGQITIKNGAGTLDVTIPANAAAGASLTARLSGNGLSAQTAAAFTVDAAQSAKQSGGSADKVHNGGITVAGKAFADWFNGDFQPRYQGKNYDEKVKGVNVPAFPHKLTADGFKKFFDHIKELTGLEEISLLQFTAAFSIPYNETGGTFKPTIEGGGGLYLPRGAPRKDATFVQFGPEGYFFWHIDGVKASYNKAKDNWARPAGDQLLAKGLIGAGDVAVWNGQPKYVLAKKPDPIIDPLDDPRYPNPQSEPLKSAQRECDFFKYRGRGFSQTTFREGYQRFVDPALKAAGYKSSDDLSNAELDNAMSDPAVYVGTFSREFAHNIGGTKGWAGIEDDAILVHIGDKFAGAGVNYGNFYRWRCLELKKAMEDAGWKGG